MTRRVVELSHPIHHGMAAYPGLPSPVVELHTGHEESREKYSGLAEFAIGRLELVGNVGTYLDSPYHRYADGPDVSQLPLERLVDLETVVIDARDAARRARRLDPALPDGLSGRAVLFHTGWDARWDTDAYWEPGPFLGETTISQLVDARPALVGVDFWNIDDTGDPARPAHTQLLAAGVPLVEHLTGLAGVTPDARTFVVPLAVRGVPSIPVRAFAVTGRTP